MRILGTATYDVTTSIIAEPSAELDISEFLLPKQLAEFLRTMRVHLDSGLFKTLLGDAEILAIVAPNLMPDYVYEDSIKQRWKSIIKAESTNDIYLRLAAIAKQVSNFTDDDLGFTPQRQQQILAAITGVINQSPTRQANLHAVLGQLGHLKIIDPKLDVAELLKPEFWKIFDAADWISLNGLSTNALGNSLELLVIIKRLDPAEYQKINFQELVGVELQSLPSILAEVSEDEAALSIAAYLQLLLRPERVMQLPQPSMPTDIIY